MALTATQTGIVQLVVSMFDAAPGKAFLDQFTADAEAGQSLNQLATNLALTTAYQTTYPDSLTNAEFAETFVGNILGDSVSGDPLAWAIEWAEGQLNAGAPRTDLIQVAAQSLLDVGSAHADFGVASATFANKIQAASNYSETESSVNMDTLIAAIANVTEDESTVPDVIVPSVEGETFDLTSSTDRLTGTADDDTFTAFLAQNAFAGGVSNSLSSADVLDGGAGTDTLTAEIVPEFFGATGDNQIDVQPRTSNIEEVTFEARDAGSNDTANTVVSVDAKNMTDIDKIGSSFSDGDLVIENLTTLTSTGVARNTEELTITMDHTDNFNSDSDASDLTVYFDEDYLLAGESVGTSQANYWLLDELSEDYEVEPLLTIERTGFSLTIDGVPYTLEMEDDVAAAADTWEAFAAGIQAVIDASDDPVAEGLSVVVDYNNTDSTFNDAGVEVTIPAISIIDAQGRDLVPTGFTSPEDVTADFDIYGRFNNIESETSQNPVTINVELDKVGREGEGGDLVIGGKELDSDGGAEDQGNGINTFNIDVLGEADKLSNLGSINSTNNALETVNIATGAEFINSATVASLTIRDAFDDSTAVETVNANSFLGDLDIGEDDAAYNVDTFTATGGGDVTYYAEIDGTEKGVFTNTTGAGSDKIIVDLDGDAVDTVGTSFAINAGSGNNEVEVTMEGGNVSVATTAALDNLSITTGTGEDKITLIGGTTNALATDGDADFNITSGAGSDFVYINSKDDSETSFSHSATVTLAGTTTAAETVTTTITDASGTATITVTTGTGDVTATAFTTVVTPGTSTSTYTVTDTAGVLTITSDSNEEFSTTTSSTGVVVAADEESLSDATGIWTVGTDTATSTFADRVLYQATLTVNFAGFEQEVTVATTAANNYVATQIDINNAIKDAIDSNPELARLLTYTDGTGLQSLTIESTVEGLNDFAIDLNQPVPTALSAADDAAMLVGLIATNSNDSTDDSLTELTAIAGDLNSAGAVATPYSFFASTGATNGTNETTVTNISTIDLGAGSNDVVVLNSDDTSANTLVFSEAWGKVSVVNFFTDLAISQIDATSQAGNLTEGAHILDFTAWLDDQTDASANTNNLSAVRNGTTSAQEAAAGVTLGSNEVVVVNDWAQATGETFDGMTAANIEAALTTAADAYGTLGTATAVTVGNLVGTSIDSILLIENDENAGEYNVFNVETTDIGLADEAFNVSLVGVIDFGAQIETTTGETIFA